MEVWMRMQAFYTLDTLDYLDYTYNDQNSHLVW